MGENRILGKDFVYLKNQTLNPLAINSGKMGIIVEGLSRHSTRIFIQGSQIMVEFSYIGMHSLLNISPV